MFGPFRASRPSLGGLLWKTPWKLSVTRKANQRKRLKRVDAVIETVRASGVKCEALTKALELPKEHEMPAKDKYTVFSPHERGYRKGIHKVPKFTRLTLRTNPKGSEIVLVLQLLYNMSGKLCTKILYKSVKKSL
ncbi:mitochondrial ribosomal protein L31-domain-containing protein [Phellopilus nigrolimitatus]|nr:mitochondrial ribosomal protein L31-domain-containing protein [Phellopilus nigrolimitatus]